MTAGPSVRAAEVDTAPAGLDRRPRRPRLRLALCATAVAVAGIALIVALVAGGGAWAPGGILNPGSVVGWSLPAARTLADLAVIGLFGQSLLAVLLPRRRGVLTPDARAALRTAAAAGVLAGVLMALTAVLTFASVIGSDATSALEPATFASLIHLDTSAFLMLSAGLLLAAALAAAWAFRAPGPDRALAPLVLAAVALAPVALTGHAETGSGHLVAITALGVHLIAACTWVGGLGALTGYALRHGRGLATVLPRYSRVAAVCFIAVGLSGLASAAARLNALPELITTDYGRIVLAKTVCYLLLGLVARRQRSRVLPAVAVARAGTAGSAGAALARRAFVRLGSAELLLMTATVGLAVALSRTPTPPAAATTAMQAELGFGMPPPVSARHLLSLAWYDPVISTLAVIGVTLYLGGVARLRHRGERWPLRRTVWWVGGWTVAVLTTCSGLGRYGAISFSGHMVQHMVLSMVAPLPMVLGAPVLLAREALDPAPPDCRGPREWLAAAAQSRAAHVLGHRGVAVVLVAVSLFGLYFTPVFGDLMSGHGGHLAMNTFFLVAGYLFHSSVFPLDRQPLDRQPPDRQPLDRQPPDRQLRGRSPGGPDNPGDPAARAARNSWTQVGTLSAAAVLHAAFAVALTASTTVIARAWYSGLGVPWVPSLIADQHLAGDLTWVFGVVPLVLALGLLLQRSVGSRGSADRLAPTAPTRP